MPPLDGTRALDNWGVLVKQTPGPPARQALRSVDTQKRGNFFSSGPSSSSSFAAGRELSEQEVAASACPAVLVPALIRSLQRRLKAGRCAHGAASPGLSTGFERLLRSLWTARLARRWPPQPAEAIPPQLVRLPGTERQLAVRYCTGGLEDTLACA